ncbi:MAG TPA: hypothetical protein VIN71_06150 [Pseudomonadales bacterium]
MRYTGISDIEHLDNEQAFIQASIQLLQQASRYLRIRSAALDPLLFDTPAFNEALSAFARKSRYSEVMILVDDADRLLKRGHRTVELMRRLSQKIYIRQYHDDVDDQRDSIIMADLRGLLVKPVDPQASGFCSLTDSVYTRQLVDSFDQDWERSPLARQLRQLMI